MNVKLSELELRIISLPDDSRTMGELAERASVTRGYISRTVTTLVDKGFVEISKNGITKNVSLTNNLHAATLRTILHKRSYMPLTELLQGSGIPILAVLSCGKTDFANLRDESGVSAATLWRWIRKFKGHAMLLSRNHEYELPHDLQDLREFLKYYCAYSATSTLREISPEGDFIAAHGFEFLFTSNGPITHENVKPSGLTAISETIPLMLTENYYFHSSRRLSVEEIAVHAVVADPHSKRDLTYVVLYILKTKLDKNLFLRVSTRYGVSDVSQSILNLLTMRKQPEQSFMPSLPYIEEKAEEYNIRW
ncbi:MAG: helix-turn-helix domain-containing protein [Euryarchaeota archaeon]|nr:helix-turn-helix domain-containing protein [Euryarchaeota archaeon]